MTETQEDVIFDTLTSTNERLMREMEEFLLSVDKSDVQAPVQTSVAGPQRPQSTSSIYLRQQRHDCGVIFEGSTEDCDIETRINAAQSSEEYDDFEMKLQSIDDTIDKALNNLQTQSQPAEYEYYNDPKYQRQSRDHSLDDDSLVAMAKRLDDASVISDPSVICGTREKFSLLTNQRYNRKSAKKFPEKTSSGKRGERSARSRRSSNGSSSSSSSSQREERMQSSNCARYKTEADVLKSTPSVETESKERIFDINSQSSLPRSYFKDNDKRTYKSGYVDHIRRETSRPLMPSSKAVPSNEYRKKSPPGNGATNVHNEQVAFKSRQKRDAIPADSGYTQTIPPRASYSDFRSRSNAINSSQDQDFDTDDGEDSDHTEFFYESTDEDSDDYFPLAVGSSVADAVKDLNNQRGLKRVMKLFGKKSKGEEDMWSVATQR